jgi:hypothetical protein
MNRTYQQKQKQKQNRRKYGEASSREIALYMSRSFSHKRGAHLSGALITIGSQLPRAMTHSGDSQAGRLVFEIAFAKGAKTQPAEVMATPTRKTT